MTLFSDEVLESRAKALKSCRQHFEAVDHIAEQNTYKVLEVFRRHKVSDYHFRTTSGYAYGDMGRQTLDKVWADICGTDNALVRTQFVSGTHALSAVLFGILRPGDELVSVAGSPYDTMRTVIGCDGTSRGSLKEFGISYKEVPLNGSRVDIEAVRNTITASTKMVLIQRSRGYSLRAPLSISEIMDICQVVKQINKGCICFVDNCYGEFVETKEPTAVGADIMAGSLIKNPGGGIAPTGGYVAGKENLVEMAASRLTAPGIGSELGASLIENRLLFQGLFMAPHITAQAIKGAIFAAAFFTALGYKTAPYQEEQRSDIIQAIQLGSPEKMVAFCRGLQKFSPVDAHVSPEPSDMPGYSDPVIMAAGTFVQGASIELSADGPIREPYIVYLQGGLTFEHSVVAIMGAAQEMLSLDKK